MNELTADELRALKVELEELQREHRDLDHIIGQMSENPYADQIQLKRLKIRKLLLKDRIEMTRSRLLPDILA